MESLAFQRGVCHIHAAQTGGYAKLAFRGKGIQIVTGQTGIYCLASAFKPCLMVSRPVSINIFSLTGTTFLAEPTEKP